MRPCVAIVLGSIREVHFKKSNMGVKLAHKNFFSYKIVSIIRQRRRIYEV